MTLEQTLDITSPRLNPPKRPWMGAVIWLSAVTLFILLFAQGFVRMGVAAWAVGLVYVVYDTGLLIFVARRTYRLAGVRPPVVAAPLAAGSAVTGSPAAGSPVAGMAVAGRAVAPVAVVGPGGTTLAVVVAAYNEAAVLQVTIEALLAQASPPEMIVIADDGSDDDSAAVLARVYGLRPPILGTMGEAGTVAPTLRWLRLPRSGKARALNVAIPLVDADIVLTVDADTLLEPGALVAMRRAFDNEPKLVAATGVLRPICGNSVSGRIFQWFQTYEYVRNFMSRYAWMGSNSLLLVSGAFAGFRREALVAVGGFDPQCLVEDYEVMHRLHRFSIDRDLGWTVRVLGDAQASTDSPGTLMPFLRQRRRWFAGFLQTQLWNRDMIGNRRYGALGTAMLPVKSLDTVQPLYGLAAFTLLVTFIVTGNFRVALPVIFVMIAKVVVDLGYLLWSLKLYRNWTGQRLSPWGAIASAVVEPLTFQLLRHAGAAWGWYVFLTKSQVWGTTARGGILSRIDAPDDRAVDAGAPA